MANHFRIIFKHIVQNPSAKLGDIRLISDAEKEEVLFKFNDTATDYPRTATTHRLFEQQVEKQPDSVALVFKNTQLTWKQLNREANRRAAHLRQHGAGPGVIIALMTDRSVETIVGILAVLKSGSAYLPIDPEAPRDRKTYILSDSRVPIVLTAANHEGELQEILDRRQSQHNAGLNTSLNTRVINLESEFSPAEEMRGTLANPGPFAAPDDLAYVIYTSGTTGKPKGTLLMHYNAVRLVKNTDYIQFLPNDRVLQLSNYVFDGSVFDIFGAMLNGSVLVMIHKEDIRNIPELPALIRRQAVTLFLATTALFNTMVDVDIDCLKHVRKILFGGEQASLAHTRKAFQNLGPGRLINAYGPTESGVIATCCAIDGMDGFRGTVPIGKPISNTTVYVLDYRLKPTAGRNHRGTCSRRRRHRQGLPE